MALALTPGTPKTRMQTLKAAIGVLALAASLATQVHAQSFLTNGLVAYYPFNGNANDASGHGNNGTLVGTDLQFSLDRFGNPQNAVFLNTTATYAWNLAGAYVAVPRAAGLDFNADFTLSVWVNHSSVANAPENLISNGNDSYGFVNLRNHCSYSEYGGKDLLAFGWGVGDVGLMYPVLLAPVRNSWWQITVARSGTNVTLFKNGSFLTNGVMLATGNNPTIWLGRFEGLPSNNGSCYPLIGGIDDVRMYNRALSSNEVAQLYAIESTPPPGFETNGLVAYYPFNGNANDASGNGSNGVAFNLSYRQNRFGEAGAAASFNGSSSFAYVTNFFSSQATQITYSIWFQTSNQVSATNTPFVMAMATALDGEGGGDYIVGLFHANRVNPNGPIIGDDGFGMYKYLEYAQYYYCDITNYTFLSNQWHHVVAVYDGSAMTLYLDGSFRKRLQYTGNGQQHIRSLDIGAHHYWYAAGIDAQYSGLIDDVRIYFRALSSPEVAQLYAIESVPPVPPCTPHKATATATLYNWFLVDATITDGGCGYTNPPAVLVQGGGGSGAAATAVVSNGMVVKINITDAGAGYTSVPKIVIGSPPFVPTLSIAVSKVKVTENVVLGRSYVLEASHDLVTWTATGPHFTAQEETLVNEFDVDLTGRYFRIRQVAP